MARKKKSNRRKGERRWSDPKNLKVEFRPGTRDADPSKLSIPARDFALPNREMVRQYAMRVRPYNEHADALAERFLRQLFLGSKIPAEFHPDPADALSRSPDKRPRHEAWRLRLLEMFQEVEPEHCVALLQDRLWLYYNTEKTKWFFVQKDREGTLRKSMSYATRERALMMLEMGWTIHYNEILSVAPDAP